MTQGSDKGFCTKQRAASQQHGLGAPTAHATSPAPCPAQGYSWAEDKEHCEEYGRMLNADPSKVGAGPAAGSHRCCMPHRDPDPARCGQVQQIAAHRFQLPFAHFPRAAPQVSARAKKRGLPQMGTLGAGNHYAEIQVGTRGRWAALCEHLSRLLQDDQGLRGCY